MKTTAALFASLFLSSSLFAAPQVLIVADEFPAMEMFADKLNIVEKIPTHVVKQADLPADLSPYSAVIVYIHRNLNEAVEKTFIDYTQAGGKLVLLHHSISSGKRMNPYWFKFLHVSLPEGNVDQGGYQWTGGVTQTIVNLAPDHFITTHRVTYPDQTDFQSPAERQATPRPCFTLRRSEVYLNHVLDGPRTPLLGLKYTDTASGKTYMQTTAGWLAPSGKGWIVYLQPGHSVRDIENPTFERILINAVTWTP